MKYIKLFEDFSNEISSSITVVVSEGFKSKMRQLNGEVTITDPFVLINPLIKGGYNLVKIGSVITKDYRDKAHEDYIRFMK